jgi:hypothetical protein
VNDDNEIAEIRAAVRAAMLRYGTRARKPRTKKPDHKLDDEQKPKPDGDAS